jgi:hypothetical protein
MSSGSACSRYAQTTLRAGWRNQSCPSRAPAPHRRPRPQTLEAAEEKLDNEIEQLERMDEDEMERMRRRRLDDLKKVHQQKQAWAQQVRSHNEILTGARCDASRPRAPRTPGRSSLRTSVVVPRPLHPTSQGHGEYRECHDQKQFFEDLKKEARAVVHFYRPATRRCEVVDKHLDALARKHIETKFMRVDAEKSPFLAERLKIWMLPTIVCIRDGRTDHSIVGFDELGGSDNFTTEQLEQLLLTHGVLMESFV